MIGGTGPQAPGQRLPRGNWRSNKAETTGSTRDAYTLATRKRRVRKTYMDVGRSHPQRGNGVTLAFWCSSTTARTNAERSSRFDIMSQALGLIRAGWSCGTRFLMRPND